MSDEELYYVQDARSYVGNSMSWWAKGNSGYVCDICKAAVYTKKEAISVTRDRDTDVAWPKEYIDERISQHIDAQHCKYADSGIK